MRRDDNSITFRRYDRGREQSLYGTLLEDTKVAQITFNMDKDRIEVYKKVNGALQLYKRIEYYDYPIVEPHTMEEDAICGTWSFSVSNWPEGGADIMEYYVEGEVTPPSPPTYYYKINPYSEGLGAPQIKYKEHDTSFISQDERDWYLIYKSNSTTAVSTTTAVKCCCVASEPIIFSPTGGGASQITIYNHSLVPGRFEYVLKSDNPNGAFRAECVVSYGSTVIKEYRDFKIGGEVCILAERQSSTTGAVTGWQERIFKIKNLRFWYPTSPADAQINMTAELELVDIGETYGSGSTGRINFDGFVLGISNIDTPTTFTFKVPNLQVKALNFTRLTTDSNITFQDAEDIASIKWYRIGDVQPTKVKGFNDIDRTNPALVKIIKLPYSPFTLTDIGNGVYILPSE